MTNLNKVKGLSGKDRWLLMQSAVLLPVVHVALRLVGYSPLRRLLETLAPVKHTGTTVSEGEIIQRAREVAGIVSIASQHGFYKATCLRRSLLVWWFLHRRGIHSSICFGVRMNDRLLEAHAWVEHKGVVLNDSMDIHTYYRRLNDVLPPTTPGL